MDSTYHYYLVNSCNTFDDMNKRAVIFCRVSTHLQDYQRQVNDLTAVAARNRWNIESEFCEKISGATPNRNRKNLLEMLEYVNTNKIDVVMVTELSRLGRDTLQVLEVIEKLNGLGVSLYIDNYKIETLSDDGRPNTMSQFLITILAEVAKMERSSIRERMASGYQNHIENGGKVGRRPGYMKDDKQLLQEYAEEIRLLKKGLSLRNISKITGTAVNTIRKCKALLN